MTEAAKSDNLVDRAELERVADVLQRRLPKRSGFTRDCAIRDAENICLAKRWHMDIFGVSPDGDRLRDMERALLAFERTCAELNETTLGTLGNLYSIPNSSRTLSAIRFHMGELRMIISMTRSGKRFRTPSGGKRNWRAASVTKACLNIWAWASWEAAETTKIQPETGEELWARTPHHVTLPPEIKAHMPKTQRYEDPGPFGRFLEEVFQALEILSRDGTPVKAANALASLRSIERQEQTAKK